jgi:hypothetical protein
MVPVSVNREETDKYFSCTIYCMRNQQNEMLIYFSVLKPVEDMMPPRCDTYAMLSFANQNVQMTDEIRNSCF